jgi:hypothetical protein
MLKDKGPAIAARSPAPAIAAVSLAAAIIAVAGWFLLRPEPLSPPDGEPWRGARALAGTWRLSQEQPYELGFCKGTDLTVYELVLDKVNATSVTGRMTIRFTHRAGQPTAGAGGACPEHLRGGDYDVRLAKDPFGQLEMTMVARACNDGGKPCPLVDVQGNIKRENDVLVFGSSRMQKVERRPP